MTLVKLLVTMTLVGLCSLPSVVWADRISHATSVVSLDYCADQYVLKLVPPDQILSLSKDATREFAYMREAARGFRQVRPVAEDIIALQPDLIVRTYGGGPNITQFFTRLDIPVLQIGYANSVDSIKTVINTVATQLGVPQAGDEIVADMERRIAALSPSAKGRQTLYVTPGGVTGGPGTLVNSMMTVAGVANYQTQPGWRSLPLEALAYKKPHLVATAFYGDKTSHGNFWSAARHPVIRDQLGKTNSVALRGATTACGGWFIVDAIELLASAAASVESAALADGTAVVNSATEVNRLVIAVDAAEAALR
jgi:iron complex transport system substrate-binding protein